MDTDMAHPFTGFRLGAAMLAAAVLSFVLLAAGLSAATDPSCAGGAAAAQRSAAAADAPSFARHVVRLLAENRYAAAWPLLHPAHRRAAGQGEYVRCERLSPVPGVVVSVQAGAAF